MGVRQMTLSTDFADTRRRRRREEDEEEAEEEHEREEGGATLELADYVLDQFHFHWQSTDGSYLATCATLQSTEVAVCPSFLNVELPCPVLTCFHAARCRAGAITRTQGNPVH